MWYPEKSRKAGRVPLPNFGILKEERE